MRWLVVWLELIRVEWFVRWRELCCARQRKKRSLMATEERTAWMASFDQEGNYLHWSGYWESRTGWCFFEGRWMWLVPENEDPNATWFERAELAPSKN